MNNNNSVIQRAQRDIPFQNGAIYALQLIDEYFQLLDEIGRCEFRNIPVPSSKELRLRTLRIDINRICK